MAAPLTAPESAPRVALALGMSGALGEALLAALVAAPRYGWIHVGHRHAAGAGASKFRPWVIGSSVIVAEDAYLVLSDDTEAPSPSPVRRFARGDALLAATIARDTGARRLALIEPGEAPIPGDDQSALATLGFDTVLVVAAGAPPAARGVRRLFNVLGAGHGAATSAQLAVAIIAELARAGPGVHRLSAADLHSRARRRAA